MGATQRLSRDRLWGSTTRNHTRERRLESIPAKSLLTAFAAMPIPRRAPGRRFSLVAILALTVAALLANQRSMLANAEWAADQRLDVLAALGCADGVTPHQTRLARLYRRLDPTAMRRVVSSFMPEMDAGKRARGQQGIAIDGKAQRGRQASTDPPTGVIQSLRAVCHDTGIVLAQEAIARLGEQAEVELTVAPQLVACLDWTGRVLTGDALFCQPALVAGCIHRSGARHGAAGRLAGRHGLDNWAPAALERHVGR
jgi:hypothetical protein